MTTKPHVNLESVLDQKDNGFNAVRLLAALAVVVSHSFMLVEGSLAARPLSWGPYELGGIAVNIFFVLSGLMLSRSYELQPDWLRFAIARILRIFPALLVSGIIVGWILVPLSMGRLNLEYFRDPQGALYPLSVVFLFEDAHVHGAFLSSTFPDDINVPLWTVKFELIAYLIFGAAAALGFLRSRILILVLCVGMGVAVTLFKTLNVFDNSFIDSIVRLGFCFLLGVSFYRFRAVIKLRPWVAVLAIAVAVPLGLTILGPVAWILALSYGALVFGALRIPLLTHLSNEWDVSFGLYIYSWPIQQLLMGRDWNGEGVLVHLAMSLWLALTLAVLSWVLIEQPALRLKSLIPTTVRRVDRLAVSGAVLAQQLTRVRGTHGPPKLN